MIVGSENPNNLRLCRAQLEKVGEVDVSCVPFDFALPGYAQGERLTKAIENL